MIIKKIFEKEFDDEVHNAFVKFSRGEFKDKYLVDGKKQASKWSIKTGPEYVNSLVSTCLQKLGDSNTPIKGVIVSTHNLKDEISFPIVKVGNFQGIRKIQINAEINPAEILALMEKYPKVFFALTFKGNDFDLKIKPKAPKSGKPGKDGEDAKAEFCTLKTNNDEVLKDLFFNEGFNWKEIKINHTLKIEGIVYPDNMDDLKPVEIREQSKRQGAIVRKTVIDGKEETKEAEFTA
ncbi:MAG: hypothetical protein HQ522_15315 [Bacteroidetes bacterium]|nr:hypothetical protein [Bacteroidota bacterium]